MSGKAKWTDKTFALKKLDNFIKNHDITAIRIMKRRICEKFIPQLNIIRC